MTTVGKGPAASRARNRSASVGVGPPAARSIASRRIAAASAAGRPSPRRLALTRPNVAPFSGARRETAEPHGAAPVLEALRAQLVRALVADQARKAREEALAALIPGTQIPARRAHEHARPGHAPLLEHAPLL